MNLRAELALSLQAAGPLPPSLFFQPGDAARLQACLAALFAQGRSLALTSTHELALGHYAELLIHSLRQRASCPVEIYFPASTQAMVARFDELLAGMTLQEALSEGSAQAPQRIWLVHDAGALAVHELQLLTRLVGQFPGAGIRLVLLLGTGLRGRDAFDTLGRRFVRWDIDPPTPEQAQAMRAQAPHDGTEALVAELLRHVQPLTPLVPLSPLTPLAPRVPQVPKAPLTPLKPLKPLGDASATPVTLAEDRATHPRPRLWRRLLARLHPAARAPRAPQETHD